LIRGCVNNKFLLQPCTDHAWQGSIYIKFEFRRSSGLKRGYIQMYRGKRTSSNGNTHNSRPH